MLGMLYGIINTQRTLPYAHAAEFVHRDLKLEGWCHGSEYELVQE